MLAKTLQVHNEEGLHSRPALEFSQLAAQYTSAVTIEKDGMSFDAKSMLMVLSACVGCGEDFVLKTDGADEEQAMAGLEQFVAALH